MLLQASAFSAVFDATISQPKLSPSGAAIAGAHNNLNGELTSDLSEMQGSATAEVGSYMLYRLKIHIVPWKSVCFIELERNLICLNIRCYHASD